MKYTYQELNDFEQITFKNMVTFYRDELERLLSGEASKQVLSKGNRKMLTRARISRDTQIKWLSNRLAAIEKGQVIQIVAEVDEHVIANSELEIKTGLRSHVGDIGIIIKQGYRDISIGTEMLKQLIAQARKRGLKIVTLGVFETNKRAKHVYEKLGFRECGRIPGEIFKNRQYIDHITMVKILDDLAHAR